MAAKEPLIVVCSNSKVYRPKPKRINKKYNIYQYKKNVLIIINSQNKEI